MAGQKVIYWIIALVFLVLIVFWQFGSGGLLENVKSAWESIKEAIKSSFAFGAEKLKADQPVTPKAHQDAVNYLQRTIENMIKSSEDDCFMNYNVRFNKEQIPTDKNGLPVLGEKMTSIEFKYRPEKSGTEMTIYGGAGGQQKVSTVFIEKMRPCVVAGKYGSDTNSAPENFDKQFLHPEYEKNVPIDYPYEGKVKQVKYQQFKKNVNEHYYTQNNLVLIKFDDGGIFGYSENRISYDNRESGKFYDFEDGGYLFKGKDNNLCFFPTVDGGTDIDGLNNDYLVNTKEERSIPTLLFNGELKWCGSFILSLE